MAGEDNSSSRTRPSLLNRLKQGEDTESWQEFYRIYGTLVRNFAIQAGLTACEAEEVVQETAIGTARNLPEYHYNPKVCCFRTWLLNQARWRIKDQLKKRRRTGASLMENDSGEEDQLSEGDSDRTSTLNRIPDPQASNLDALFEQEWRKNLLAAALERIKDSFSPKQFQIFDRLVIQEWPSAQVAKSLGVSLANVYVSKHRVSVAVKKEILNLENHLEAEAQQRLSTKSTAASLSSWRSFVTRRRSRRLA
jgi:RNA polymerase sigma factor (sigma-70 family)